MMQNASDTDAYIIFSLDGRRFAAALPDIREVVLIAELSKGLGPSETIAGFLNMSGDAIPVVKLGPVLGLQAEEASLYSHILLLRERFANIGFLTQGVQKMIRIPQSDIKPLVTDKEFKGFGTGMIPEGQEFIVVLSLPRIAELYHDVRASA